MKKTIKISAFVLSLTLLITASVSVRAEEIPGSSVPQNATEESILITENLISGILDEVSQGLGYLEARSKANNLIYNAVLSGQAGGYGYGLLSPIACNAIFEYRDIYLRPDFYVAAEENVRNMLADLITQVETGMDYEEARKEAYTRIYRSVDPNFDPSEREMTDFCYWDTPAVDSAMFNRARKVLLEAEAKYKTQFNVQ